ncbi:hypothetical protein L0F63_004188 [Massospora cicadina]|nr:hypothetical protein L0F63_004188 [Massospora cicadina]
MQHLKLQCKLRCKHPIPPIILMEDGMGVMGVMGVMDVMDATVKNAAVAATNVQLVVAAAFNFAAAREYVEKSMKAVTIN